MSRRTARMRADLRAITRLLRILAGHLSGFARLLGEHRDVAMGKQVRQRPTLTAKHRAALKLQGRYMGLLRGLPARKAAAVKRIRAEKGVRAAIASAK